MISNSQKFIFVHIKKTAGSSILAALRQFSATPVKMSPKTGTSVQGKHWTATRYIDGDGSDAGLGLERWYQYLTFAVIRNPWDRMLSMYCHLGRTSGRKLPTFVDWLMGGFDRELSQLDYLTYQGQVTVSRILRYENLAVDFAKLCRDLWIEPPDLPHLNRTQHGSYHTYYPPLARDFVAEQFAAEIEYFDYRF